VIPCPNARFALGLERRLRITIRAPPACVLEEAAPRLDLGHPGTGHRRAGKDHTQVLVSPLADGLAGVRPDMITPAVKRLAVLGNRCVQRFKKGTGWVIAEAAFLSSKCLCWRAGC
jgi:hypothetical protein